MTKQCLFCGKFFTPDHRVKKKQKACFDPECKKKRKKAAQEAWVKKNPGYFADHYEAYVKSWRQKIKDEIRPVKQVQKLILLIPDGMIKDEITLKRVGVRTFAAAGYG